MDIPIKKMLANIGVTDPESQTTATSHLADSCIISRRRRRTKIAGSKLKRVEESLREGFVWHCNSGDCKQSANAGAENRPQLLVEKSYCSHCGGSADRQALQRMAEAMATASLSRVLVVGGTEKKTRELQEKSGNLQIEWRFIDGTKAKDSNYYRPHRNWADVIVIWGSTPLDHRVSVHFTECPDSRVVALTRRSIGALAQSVIGHLQK